MKNAAPCLLVFIALVIAGCSGERAQVAADGRAGVLAADLVLSKVEAAPSLDQATKDGIAAAMAILDGVNARLPAVAGVSSAEWPAPAVTPEAIAADPATYAHSAPPEPAKTPWGTMAAVGLGGLFLLGRLAPAIPGLGTAVGAIADGAYAVLAHGQQKAADASQAALAASAAAVRPVAQALREMPVDSIPKPLQGALTGPVLDAVIHLSDPALLPPVRS